MKIVNWSFQLKEEMQYLQESSYYPLQDLTRARLIGLTLNLEMVFWADSPISS